jgi:hypothetical protein
MSHEALVGLILLGVVSLGAAVLWAIRKRAGAWADQYETATEDEARGLEADYPVIGSRARRLSWQRAILLLAGVIVLLTATVLWAQSAARPELAELTLLGLDVEAEPADVARVLGPPDSVHSYPDPHNPGGRLQTLHYRHVLVFIGPDGLKIGVKLIAPEATTRRGLAVGDSLERALMLYGPPDARVDGELRWRIRGNDHLVVEVRRDRVACIFAGHVDPTNPSALACRLSTP